MKLTAESSGGSRNYTPHPKGPAIATCIDVVDMGMQESTFQGVTKMKPKVRFVFVTSKQVEVEKDGQTIMRNAIISARFTASLHENSALRPWLTSWLGDDVTEIELEDLIGMGAQINVTHTPKEDGSGVWDNIAAIMPVPEGFPLPEAPDYVRVKDRDPVEGRTSGPQPIKQQARQNSYRSAGPERLADVPPVDDDDLPF